VTGLDVSGALLELAAEREPRARFVHGSVYAIPFATHEFDAVWAVASLLHIPKPRIGEALAEIRRVLRPGGGLFVVLKTGAGEETVTSDLGSRFFSYWQPDEINAELEQAGFDVRFWHQRDIGGASNWLCTFAVG
jgi:ubiquinone/menaquinone biosynthesis C-methylase UbiE